MLSALLDTLCVVFPRLSDAPILTTLFMQAMHLYNIRALGSALILACFSHQYAVWTRIFGVFGELSRDIE
jgi:hypothetical protein